MSTRILLPVAKSTALDCQTMQPAPGPPTPILDRIEPPPPLRRSRKMQLLWIAFGVVLGLSFNAITSGISLQAEPFPFADILLFLVFFQLGIALHEGGHVLAGFATGFSCGGVTACSYHLLRTLRGWRFHFQWNRFLAGGMAYLIPARSGLENWRYAAMVAGGPLASLLVVPIALLAPAVFRGPAVIAWGLIALIALLPLRAGPHVTDTLRLFAFLRGGDEWERWKFALASFAQNAQGVPPRQWDPEPLRQAASYSGGNVQDRFYANLIAYLAAVDRGDCDEAAGLLETVLLLSGQIGAPTRRRVFLEAAFFQAWRRQNAVLGRAWLAEAGAAKGVDRFSVAAAESAVLFAEGSFEAASHKASFAIAHLQRKVVGAATTQQAVDELRKIVERCQVSLRPKV